MKTTTIIIAAMMSAGATYVHAGEQLFINNKQNNTMHAPPSIGQAKSALLSLKGLKLNPAASKAEELNISLPNGVVLDASRVNQYLTKSGSSVWIGKYKNQTTGLIDVGGEETILVTRNGKITGNIRNNGKLYEIRAEADGSHIMQEIDTTQFFDHTPGDVQSTPYTSASELRKLDAQALNLSKKRKNLVDEVASFDLGIKTPTSSSIPSAVTSMAPAPTAMPVIHLLVNYTQKVKATVADVDALIDLSIAQTNQGYVNSGVNARVELAHKAQVNYVESLIATDKPRYAGKTDGYMDEIHAQRDQYGADVGILLAEFSSGEGCGSASAIGAVESNAFVVVKRSCSTGSYSFGHEIGHLFGALHDPETTSTMLPYSYGHGYQSPDNKWRTVMAYTCNPSCPRLNYWSTPLVTYTDGQLMGDTTISNNARVLNERALALSAFRNDVSTNVAPSVNAGADTSVRIPASINLVGTASDDGKPTNGSMTTTWTKVSGPGTVTVGNASTLNTTASFSAAGVYVLRLTATDSLLQTSDDVTITVTSNQAPVAQFTSTVTNLNVQFTDSSSDSDGSILSRNWSFGDGTSSTETNPSKTYATAGTYNVTLTVTDNNGASNVKSASVTTTATSQNAAPIANFTFTSNNLVASFTNTSTDSDGTVVAWSWAFGDGTTSTSKNVNKTYGAAGTYTVTLIATDDKGANSTITSKQVTVTTTPNNVEIVLEQNTSGGSSVDIQKGQDGAQSFKYGSSGTYVVTKLEFYVSRESTAPDGPLVVSLGTSKNAGAISNTTANINSSAVTNSSSGSTFQKMTITYNQPVVLNAGTTYYINMKTTAPNTRNYYVEYTSSSTYSKGQYYDDGVAKTKDLRFTLFGY